MKIISWNINGIKSTHKNGYLDELIKNENPDILCIQEIKTVDVPTIDGYALYSYPHLKGQIYMVLLFIQKLILFLLKEELVMKNLTWKEE